MDNYKNLSKVPKVNCEVCLKEIPRSEAKIHEAEEYVIWFCGLECYDEWRKTEASRLDREKK